MPIPEELRETCDLEPGDQVVWREIDDGIALVKRSTVAGRGLLLPDDAREEQREAVADELARRVRERRDRIDEDS